MKTIIFLQTLVVAATALPASHNTPLKQRDTSHCPLTLPADNYEFPHLIIPINNSDVALGNSYFPSVSPDDCATIFNFDIPVSRADQQCSLYFSFPEHNQLVTSDYKWNGANTNTEGPGTLSFAQYVYNTGAASSTTGNSQPPLGPGGSFDVSGIQPGNSYKIWTGSCGGGGIMSWRMSSPDSWLYYFQDWNPCAIGLWVIYETAPPLSGDKCSKCPS